MVSAAVGPAVSSLGKLIGSSGAAAGIGAGLGLGAAAGGAVSQVALLPFNAANNFIGSGFFGYGMILGERYAYQNDWPKIQKRLESGEQIENIMGEYAGTFTAMIMEEAKIIFSSLSQGMSDMIAAAVGGQVEIDAFTAGRGGQAEARDQRVGASQINIDGEVFIQAGSQQAKDISATGFTRLKETPVQQHITKIQAPVNKQIDKIITSAPKAVPFAGGAQIFNRNKLIQEISALGQEISLQRKRLASSATVGGTVHNKRLAEMDVIMGKLNKKQLELAVLLSNFNWSRLT